MRVQKAVAISDAKIQFVSLVDKAANQRQFLIAKAKDGTATFTTVGRILKVDDATHYITGIVYEPMVEDAHGNYMTEDEIRKAAYWYAKNGDEVDIQHSFDAVDGVTVVENYVAPCDMDIAGTPVVKGTWLMTIEVSNAGVWEAVQKGEITGFSMGGVGKYSEEDTKLEDVNKSEPEISEKKGLFKRLANLLGFDVVEKGQMADTYAANMKDSGFWNAFYTLEDLLHRYNWQTDRYELETDEATIREALADFSAIITELLTEKAVAKALSSTAPVNKAGKKMSGANKKKLDAAYQALTELRDALADEEDEEESIEKEEINLDKKELQAMIDESVEKAVGPLKKALEEGQAGTPEAAESPAEGQEAATETASAAPSAEDLQKMIDSSVSSAIDPLLKALKARGVSSNLNDSQVEKAGEQHYLHGLI